MLFTQQAQHLAQFKFNFPFYNCNFYWVLEQLDFRKIHYKVCLFYTLLYRFPVNIFLFYVITTTLASLSVAAISVHSPAIHPWVSLVSIHCLSFAGQFACSTCPALRSLIYPKSYPPLFVFLPTFLSWLLIGHSSLPEFVSFDTTYSPSCYSTFSDNFLFSNSSLEFTTWRGSICFDNFYPWLVANFFNFKSNFWLY